MPLWLSPTATMALMQIPTPLSFLPYLTSRKQQVWPDSHLPIYHSWIVFFIVMLLGYIDHLYL